METNKKNVDEKNPSTIFQGERIADPQPQRERKHTLFI
jgi:hypothetical protein